MSNVISVDDLLTEVKAMPKKLMTKTYQIVGMGMAEDGCWIDLIDNCRSDKCPCETDSDMYMPSGDYLNLIVYPI